MMQLGTTGKIMKTSVLAPLALAAALLPQGAAKAFDTVRGTEVRYQSYNGIEERCVRIDPFPGGDYAKSDLEDETRLCSHDFYDESLALCPKIWSTSAAVILYDLKGGPMEGKRRKFQEDACALGKLADQLAGDELARLKMTMNRAETSGTNSASALLYYHFSRGLGFTTRVPVSVWRSIDKEVMLGEVAESGVEASAYDSRLKNVNAAWRTLVQGIKDPASYTDPFYGTADEFLTADGKQVYGVFYRKSGDSYGPIMNAEGDAGENGEGYEGFRRIPAYVALTTGAPLEQAIARGLAEGRYEATEDEDKPGTISAPQMAFWMRELSETLLIDFMMGQQDRLSNIEYVPYWYWLENGREKHVRTKDGKPGDGKVPADAIFLRRTRLNDNDAAARVQYDNWTRKMGLLEPIRHFDAGVYRRLMALDADFQGDGPARTWLAQSFGLSAEQVAMIVDNTRAAAAILRATCERGEMIFDLDPTAFLETGRADAVQQPCSGS